jgi:hypothetical protein
MAKYKESARYHIVSVRVSKAEREILEKISLESKKNVSDLMREALQLMIPVQTPPKPKSRLRIVHTGKKSAATAPVLRPER